MAYHGSSTGTSTLVVSLQGRGVLSAGSGPSLFVESAILLRPNPRCCFQLFLPGNTAHRGEGGVDRLAHSLARLRAVQSLDSGAVDLLLGALHGHINSQQVRNVSHQPLERSLGMHLRQQIIIDIRSTLHKHKLHTGFALGRQLCSRHGTAIRWDS